MISLFEYFKIHSLVFSGKVIPKSEYRRQVENFSACRIQTLQFEYVMRQLKTQQIVMS